MQRGAIAPARRSAAAPRGRTTSLARDTARATTPGSSAHATAGTHMALAAHANWSNSAARVQMTCLAVAMARASRVCASAATNSLGPRVSVRVASRARCHRPSVALSARASASAFMENVPVPQATRGARARRNAAAPPAHRVRSAQGMGSATTHCCSATATPASRRVR